MEYCVMVQAPCRGKMCDFWARIKIKKKSLIELVEDIKVWKERVETLQENAICEYWKAIGIKDLDRLAREEPELWCKMQQAEQLALR